MAPIDKDDYEELSVFDQLVELISKMTDAEQAKLLEALKKRQPPEEREQRISLYTETTFTVGGEDYTGIVLDLSAGGCFIETEAEFSTGQEVSIRMKRSKDAKTIKLASPRHSCGRLKFWVPQNRPTNHYNEELCPPNSTAAPSDAIAAPLQHIWWPESADWPRVGHQQWNSGSRHVRTDCAQRLERSRGMHYRRRIARLRPTRRCRAGRFVCG